tara:strand:- start:379 stop:603 length:225 start_codon:yes stop_codon:yes gene_type:complete
MADGEDNPSHKEACQMFWIVKGHLNSSMDTIYSCYNGYFKRMWCRLQGESVEFNSTLDGFEEAYKKMLDKQANL